MVILTFDHESGFFDKDLLFKKFNLPENHCFSGKICKLYQTFKDKKPLVYFIKNNQHHRYYGPAAYHKSIISKKEDYSGWHLNGTLFGYQSHGYSQSKFLKDVNKKWLL